MTMLVLDPRDQELILAARQESGGDRFDEVWDGVYMMSPLADNEHQELQFKLGSAIQNAVDPKIPFNICCGVNVSNREEEWEHNYRCPDVVVFASDTKAKNCGAFWLGGPDFAIEITSPYDRSRDKIDFYSNVGVRELVILDRQKWRLELHRLTSGKLQLVQESTPDNAASIASNVLGLSFRLIAGKNRPMIEVIAADGRSWKI